MAFNRNRFRGTGVAIVTPFRNNGELDLPSLKKVIEHIIGGGCEYIVTLGTTGESVTLSKKEKADIVNFTVNAVNKRVPVVLGLGGNNTAELLHDFTFFNLDGISALLSVSPYYNKPSQRGIYQHYKLLSEASPLPIILYNVPGRTSSNITAETTLKLAGDFKNIIGIKEASGNFEQVMKIIKNRPKNFLVLSGDDAVTLPILSCGGDGVISVVANAYPKGFSEMVRQALAGNYGLARKLHYRHIDIIEQLFADGSPAGVKQLLELMKLCSSRYVRLPLIEVNPEVRKRIADFARAY